MTEWLTWKAAKVFLGKNWEIILLVLLIAGGLWFVDHRGYERAKTEDTARQLEQRQITAAVVRSIDGELTGKLNGIAAANADKIQTIETEGKTVVQPIITRELVRDPGLAAPGSCLTPGLLEAVNAARGYGFDELAGGADAGSANPATVPGSAARH